MLDSVLPRFHRCGVHCFTMDTRCSWLVFLSLCTIVCSSNLQSEENSAESCQGSEVLLPFIPSIGPDTPGMSWVFQEVHGHTGLDLSDDEDRLRLACALIESDSLEELAARLDRPVHFFYHYYTLVMSIIMDPSQVDMVVADMREGVSILYHPDIIASGSPAILYYYDRRQSAQVSLDEWKARTGYPSFPLSNTSESEIEGGFSTLAYRYPQSHLVQDVGNVTAQQLASILTTSQTESEVLEGLGITWLPRLTLYTSIDGRVHDFFRAIVSSGAFTFETPSEPEVPQFDDVSDDCFHIIDQLITMQENERLNLAPVPALYARLALQYQSDYKLLDMSDIKAFACRLASVRTKAEMAELLNVDNTTLNHYYTELLPIWYRREFGDPQNLHIIRSHVEHLYFFSVGTRFPSLPLRIPARQLEHLITDHVIPLSGYFHGSGGSAPQAWEVLFERVFPIQRMSAREIALIYEESETEAELEAALFVDDDVMNVEIGHLVAMWRTFYYTLEMIHQAKMLFNHIGIPSPI